MKSSLIGLAVTLILVSVALAIPSHNVAENHSVCLSQDDVNWFTNRSKSGIPRTCSYGVLQENIDKLKNQ